VEFEWKGVGVGVGAIAERKARPLRSVVRINFNCFCHSFKGKDNDSETFKLQRDGNANCAFVVPYQQRIAKM
jgi:hypothetical protein